MKTSTKRCIPPPIDLSASGSNLMREATTRHGLAGELSVGDHPPAYGWRHAVYVDQEVFLPPLSAPLRRISSLKSTQMWMPALSTTSDWVVPSSSDSCLSVSEWDGLRLVPNRRRSYSESGFSSLQQSGYGTLYSEIPPSTPASYNSTTSGPKPTSLKPSLSFNFGFKRSKILTARDRYTSADGKKNKIWSSLAYPSLNTGIKHDSGKSSDGVSSTTSPRKLRRPGTSPSTPSSYISFIDTGGPGMSASGKHREEISRKHQRPSTASSTGSRSFSLRMSKLDWQWKRLSLLRSPPSSISSFSSHPSPPSLSPSSSLSSMSSPSSSNYSTPTTPKEVDSQCLPNGKPLAKGGLQQPNAKLMMLTNNRPIPNLQAPALSREDLGKVNAFYAPPPPAHAIQALSDAKVTSMLPLPLETPKTAPRSRPPIQTNVKAQNMKGQGIPIGLPLSPIRGTGEYEGECSILYLTVEDAWDEESGEVTHQLVEVSM